MTLIYHGRLFVFLCWMFVFTSSYITSSIDILCITTIHIKATLLNMVMIHRHFLWLSPIRLIIVLSFDSYISWQIVLPSLLNVCLHFLLYIYIFNWYFMHHYHTYEGHINKNGYDLQALSFYTWLWYIMAYCLSFLWNVFLQIFLYIYIFNLYSMHHYHTH